MKYSNLARREWWTPRLWNYGWADTMQEGGFVVLPDSPRGAAVQNVRVDDANKKHIGKRVNKIRATA